MASENNDIGDIVKKCKILLLDIEGTTTSISFVKDKLFPYAEANVKEFLESQWEADDVKEVVSALRKLAVEDEEQKVEGVVSIPGEDVGKDEQIEGLVKSVKWQMSADRKAGPLKQLQGLIWKQGYDKGDIKGHVYDDVAPALSLWNASEGQKVYIYSSGSVQAQKLLFNFSVAGDLLPHIEGHFDTAVGAKQEAASYAAIVDKIGCKPEEILFLTDIVKEAEAARASGLQAALVTREGNAPLPADATSSYPVIQSFDQLTVTNKRKPEPQEQEIPAKIPKTDPEANVKTAEMEVAETVPEPVAETVTPPEAISTSENITDITNGSEPEKMEVEEDVPIAEVANVTEKVEEVAKEIGDTAERVETVIEEVAIINEAGDAPVCDVKPVVIEEIVEKTDKNETEMEAETAENVEMVETVVEPKEQTQEKVSEESAPVAEETSPAIVIQEVTNDQEIGCAGIEFVEDLVPVVEEPPAVEMEVLKNVADVLDKECDEILLKMRGVTNLDNIPVKPLLNSIAEEDIEVENGENTNDIVDSILDTELELGAKLCEDIDINIKIVQEMSDTKPEAEVTTDKVDEVDAEVNKTEEITGEKPVEENVITESIVADKAEKVEEVTCSVAVAEEVEEDSNVVTPEVTNGDGVQESPVEAMPEAESVIEVEINESKEITTDVALEPKVAESEDNKMESEESSTIVVENQSESKESEIKLADSTDKSEQTVPVPVESEMETKETTEEQLDNKMEESEDAVIEKNEVKESNPTEIVNEKESADSIVEAADNKMESEDSPPQESSAPLENENKENIVEPEVETESKVNENDNETPAPAPVPEAETASKDTSNDVEMETEATEKVNGKMNGETEVNQNGDASKEEELSARLSVENGDNNKEVNGANGNGDSPAEEKDSENIEAEIPDIKVKTVATDEPRPDPIEQPVEA